MKKVLLTAMTLVSIATSSVFGYYGANNDWVDFLTDGNQFRARTRQMGVVLGNGTIKGVVGFRDESETALGQIFTPATVTPEGKESKNFLNFMPTVSAGIGYTTEAFGIGIGYNYKYNHEELKGTTKNGYGLSVHTPVVTMNFLNNNLRIAVPVQVGVKNGDTGLQDKDNHTYYTGVSLDPQIRYYTGIDAFSEVRLTVKYGMNETGYVENGKTVKDSVETISSFGFDFRTYFGAQVGDVGLKPFLKITYDTSLDATKTGLGDYGVQAGDGRTHGTRYYNLENGEYKSVYDSNPWELNVLPTLGLSANSDIVSIYVEAGLGYKAVNTGFDKQKQYISGENQEGTPIYSTTDFGIKHSLSWSSYGEISIRPIQDLEWYFEAEIASPEAQRAGDKIKFNSATGITWYLPSFQN